MTGANYLLETDDIKILIECGMFQGSRYVEDLNYEKFPYNPSEIDFVFITHSHTDHIGRLPKLYREGFRGDVIATDATIDLARKALPDNLNLIKQEAKETEREPLFSLNDLEGVLKLARGVRYEEEVNLGPVGSETPLLAASADAPKAHRTSNGIKAILHDAGHILGSSIVEIQFPIQIQNSKPKSQNLGRLYFTGDLGNPPTPLLKPYKFVNDADYVVIESVYGSRTHEDKTERKDILQKVITETIQRGGVLMIPSFAMERTQELLYELNGLFNGGEITKVPVFVDSPLAGNLTEVYRKHSDYFNEETEYIIKSGDDIFNFPGLKFTRTAEESKRINDVTPPKIIIAGSGMSTGGRILHHERRYLPDPNSTILFIGYQVKNSLGRKVLDGEKEVKIFGEKVAVQCDIKAIGGYSAHADQNMLLEWVRTAGSEGRLKRVFVVQGEEDSSLILAEKIKRVLNIEAVVPEHGQSFKL